MKFQISRKLEHRCVGCNFCTLSIACPGEVNCIGCGACVSACPYSAKFLREITEERRTVELTINGVRYEVPERITVLRALELAGFEVSRLPSGGDIFAPCKTGGCWACAVVIDGKLKPSCITPVGEGMVITTGTADFTPLRLVSGFHGHSVGGVGTPHWLKPRGFALSYIEVACFAHGCILRCPTCQNWQTTYSSIEEPLTPEQAARFMTRARRECRVDRMAMSGGEPTLNRRWLVEYLKKLRELNSDAKARLHVDTNAVLLTRDYIDELVDAGMTDIGPDVKGLELETFMRITSLGDEQLARELLRREWEAVEYLLERHYPEVFVGIGIPYNSKLISLEEVHKIGERIAELEPKVQVCALDYRAEFRRKDIRKPSYEEMIKVKRTLEEAGLRCVIAQTERGHIGPE